MSSFYDDNAFLWVAKSSFPYFDAWTEDLLSGPWWRKVLEPLHYIILRNNMIKLLKIVNIFI